MALPDFTDTQWRNSGHQARLGLVAFSLDARVFVFFLALILHLSWTTFYIVLSAIAFFAFLEYLGYTLDVARKRVRGFLAGKMRSDNRRVILRRRRLIDA